MHIQLTVRVRAARTHCEMYVYDTCTNTQTYSTHIRLAGANTHYTNTIDAHIDAQTNTPYKTTHPTHPHTTHPKRTTHPHNTQRQTDQWTDTTSVQKRTSYAHTNIHTL